MDKRLKLLSGQEIPVIGFGTWKMQEGPETQQAVDEAISAGYRLIDTARIYGNEVSVGKAVKKSEVPREELFITTKLWNDDQGYDEALEAFEYSLARLDMNYVDLYLIHWPATEKRDKAWVALQQLFHEGRARSIGVSNYTIEQLEEVIGNSEVVPAVNQIEFHPFNYHQQKTVLDFCNTKGIIVEAYSPLAHGNQLNHPVLTKIAQETGKSTAQIMIRWCIQHGTVPIPKSSHLDRIVENASVFDFSLTDQQMHVLDTISA